MSDWLELRLPIWSDQEFASVLRKGASTCPRCTGCGHHPSAHAGSGCQVVVERNGSKSSKCGCSKMPPVRQSAVRNIVPLAQVTFDDMEDGDE